MGRFIKRSGDTISRLLQPAEESRQSLCKIAQAIFHDKKKLFCIIDDTLIHKIYSQLMQGSGFFFDTKIGRSIMAYRLIIGLISDGKFAIPIDCAYLFSKELLDLIDHNFKTKDEIAIAFIQTALKLFPHINLITAADGLYATVKFIKWCSDNKIKLEARMHSNRVVEYKGEKVALKTLATRAEIRPRGRQKARTIPIIWQGLELEITIVKRINKRGKKTIVFQVATYHATPKQHVRAYDVRWSVEKLIRTTKQHLGLKECYSRSLQKQHSHCMAVLLAYALVQLEMKRRRLKTPEEAIRLLKMQNVNALLNRFGPLAQIFHEKKVGYA